MYSSAQVLSLNSGKRITNAELTEEFVFHSSLFKGLGTERHRLVEASRESANVIVIGALLCSAAMTVLTTWESARVLNNFCLYKNSSLD